MKLNKKSKGNLLEYVSNAGVLLVVIAVSVAFCFFPKPIAKVQTAPEDSVGASDPQEFDSASLPDVSEEFTEIINDTELIPPDEGVFYTVYKVVKGDTISEIAQSYGITTDAIVSMNDIKNARALSIGRYLKIPTINGILYKTKKGDNVDSLAKTYSISKDRIIEINKLAEYSADTDLPIGKNIFLPDARMSSWALREISGDLFSWPIRGWITSWYGWRNDPFTGSRSFHSGIDIGANKGTKIKAAMEGRVSATGYSTISGNYVVISHHSGYSTMYGHLDRIDVKAGRYVTQNTVIGAVGSTGYSTGPHLHFTVYKYGKTLNPMIMLH